MKFSKNDLLGKTGWNQKAKELIENQNLVEEIKRLTKDSKSFKIGKTGQSLKDRKNEADYKEAYNYIKEVYASEDSDLISELEKELIKIFRKKDERCENKQDGGNGLDGENGQYFVYVVVKI
ncbi:MAG: hypothetical protein RBT87_04830 [bacterium]|nr:hypothetical protein [bacterium]